MTSSLTSIQSDTFKQHVLAHGKPVLVDFGAPWCAPCRRLGPMLADAAAQHNVAAFYVDIEQSPDLARLYNVRAVPSILIFSDGVEVRRHTGLPSRSVLKKLIEQTQ